MGSRGIAIYLIRHATPDWSRIDIPYHLPPGPPLTDQGDREAGALGEFLRTSRVEKLITSPLERCRRTAQIAAQIAGSTLDVDENLTEWQMDEDKTGVSLRMMEAFQNAQKESQGNGPVGLVTHGGPIAMLLRSLGMDAETLEYWRKFDHRNPVPCAGVWEATRVGSDKSWQLKLVFNHSE